MLYAVVTYANMRGVRAVDRIVDLCQRDLAFIWLTKGEKPQRDDFYDFKGKKLTGEVLDELNYQFMRRLEKEGLITLKELYIDGTKIEANANRYTFVWRGSLNYHLANLLDTIDTLYAKYNAFLLENGYGPKYDLGNAHMFVIEGMDKVRKIIEENRKRKLTKHMLVSIPPQMSIFSFMGYLKGKSALMMFDRHANLKYKFGNRHFWSEGYYVSTVGLNEATIKKYIQEREKYDIMQDK